MATTMAALLLVVRAVAGRTDALRFVSPWRFTRVRFMSIGRVGPVRMASTLTSPRSAADEVQYAFNLAKVAGDEYGRRYLELWAENVEKDREAEKLAGEKNTLAAQKEAEKSEKNTLAAEKLLVEKELVETTFKLANYEAVLQPRMLMEIALRAKYPPEHGKKFVATVAWARFYKEHVLDAAADKLGAAAATIARDLGCPEHSNVLKGNLETLYNRLSQPLHHRKFAGYRSGLYMARSGPVRPGVRPGPYNHGFKASRSAPEGSERGSRRIRDWNPPWPVDFE